MPPFFFVKNPLVLRLSSLGDLVLSLSALEVRSPVDWVVSSSFSSIIIHHPKIEHLFIFDRTQGLKGWVHLCRQLWLAEYQEVFDLHVNLRTLFMRGLFFFWSLRERKPMPRWKSVHKQRCRLYAYFIFKGLLPKFLRPTLWVSRFAECLGGDGTERPNFRHLLTEGSFPIDLKDWLQKHSRYYCIMPSSQWTTKNWPVSFYAEFIQTLSCPVVILGQNHDQASHLLCFHLTNLKIPYFSGIGKWNLAQVAHVLTRSEGYLGGDTGLSHLSEALGVKTHILFGPTTSDMGFGPSTSQGHALESEVHCRPCSRDGRACYYLFSQQRCLKEFSVESLLKQWKKFYSS